MNDWLVDDLAWTAVHPRSREDLEDSSGPFESATPMPAYPALDDAAQLIWWPARSSIGVFTYEGKPRHASALVERKLRADGVIDGAAKVFVPRVQVLGKLCHAFYMAVEVEEWSRMRAWEAGQDQQCLVIPVLQAALRLKGVADLVVIHGRTEIVVLGTVKKKAIYLNAVTFGAGPEELSQVLGGLALRLRDELGAAASAAVNAVWLPWQAAVQSAGHAAQQQAQAELRRSEPLREAERSEAGREPGHSWTNAHQQADGDGELLRLERFEPRGRSERGLGTDEFASLKTVSGAGVRSAAQYSQLQGSDVQPRELAGQPEPGKSSDLDGLVAQFSAVSGAKCWMRATRLLAEHQAARHALLKDVGGLGSWTFNAGLALEEPPSTSRGATEPSFAPHNKQLKAEVERDDHAQRPQVLLSGFVGMSTWDAVAASVNTDRAKLAALAELAIPVLAGAGALLLALSLGFSVTRFVRADRLQSEAAALSADARSLSASSSVAVGAAELKQEAARDMDFLDVLTKAEFSIDVLDVVLAVRQASLAGDVRILGMRLEESVADTASVKPASGVTQKSDPRAAQAAMLIDGRFASATISDSRASAEFTRALRGAGYIATPVDIKGAVASLNDSSRLFSYRVTRVIKER